MAKVLRLNDRNESVKSLQQALNQKLKAGLVADGHFGAKTEAAVKRFQSANGLVADGIAGAKTQAALALTLQPIRTRELTIEDYIRTGKVLGCAPWMVHALALKETRSRAYMDDGRPVVLFERHQFYRRMKNRKLALELCKTDKEICHPTAKRSGSTVPLIDRYRGGYTEYAFLDRARNHDEVAALESASYGMFQVMGFNWKLMGYASVHEYVDAMQGDVYNHLDALVRFVKNNSAALRAIRAGDVVGLAKAYNGAAYAKNNYDTALAKLIDQVRPLYK